MTSKREDKKYPTTIWKTITYLIFSMILVSLHLVS